MYNFRDGVKISDAIDQAKITVFGMLGEDLKEMDNERLIAIVNENPDLLLFMIANVEIEDIFNFIESNKDRLTEKNRENLIKEVKKRIMEANKKHIIFKQVANFLNQENRDYLAIGGLTVGRDTKHDIAVLFGEKRGDD